MVVDTLVVELAVEMMSVHNIAVDAIAADMGGCYCFEVVDSFEPVAHDGKRSVETDSLQKSDSCWNSFLNCAQVECVRSSLKLSAILYD